MQGVLKLDSALSAAKTFSWGNKEVHIHVAWSHFPKTAV